MRNTIYLHVFLHEDGFTMKSKSERIISKEKSFLSKIWRICPIPGEIFLLFVHCKTMSGKSYTRAKMLRRYTSKKREKLLWNRIRFSAVLSRVAGASATAAAMSGLVPAASAAGIKDLWSMDLQILATSDTTVSLTPGITPPTRLTPPAAWPSRQLPSREPHQDHAGRGCRRHHSGKLR